MIDQSPDILLVEDNPNDIAVAMRAFRRRQIESRVRVLRDGDEALGFLRGPDEPRSLKVVFLDIKMPRIDGFEVLRAIREDERMRHIPVVVVSSSDRENDVRKAYALGANSYVVKQFDPMRPGEYLVDAARYWVDLNRPER